MTQPLTCAIMRGGTSKGVYLLREQLPTDEAALKRVLLAVMGSPDPRQIDGLGGGEMLTSKVAMVAKSTAPDADIDYHFAQVSPGKTEVDLSPTCGNILSGVGAFAIELGMHPAQDGETALVVRDVNTGAYVEQVVQTPNGRVTYEGDCAISGAPGTAAPVILYYLRFAGAKTGKLFPAGAETTNIGGTDLTCIDAAMPVIFADAADFGLTGRETPEDLKTNTDFFIRMEALRLEAAKLMGLGDARGQVIPKFALVSPAQDGENADIVSRYFTPTTPHAAYAVSGGMALATALATPGTISHRMRQSIEKDPPLQRKFLIQHPSGTMEVDLHMTEENGVRMPHKAGVVRTARLLMLGEARVAEEVLI